jgi:hypothetical protein
MMRYNALGHVAWDTVLGEGFAPLHVQIRAR